MAQISAQPLDQSSLSSGVASKMLRLTLTRAEASQSATQLWAVGLLPSYFWL